MDNQEIIKIEPQKQNLLLTLAWFVLLPIATYYFYRKPVRDFHYWFDIGLIMLAWVALITVIIRQVSYKIYGKTDDANTLKLMPQGFYRGDKLYKWHDIDSFGVKPEYTTLFSLLDNRQVVFWKYKPNYKKPFLRFISGYDDALFTKYEMEPVKLAGLLNEWKTRYTGQHTEIDIGGRFNRNLTAREVVFIIIFIVLLVAAIIAITAFFIDK